MTAAVKRRVDSIFGLDQQVGGGGNKCPGEDSCGDFKREAGATREEKAAAACSSCELLATKPKTSVDAVKNDRIENFVTDLYRIRGRRISGFPLSESELTSLQYEALITLDYLTECAEKESSYITRTLLEQNLMANQKLLSALFGGGKKGK